MMATGDRRCRTLDDTACTAEDIRAFASRLRTQARLMVQLGYAEDARSLVEAAALVDQYAGGDLDADEPLAQQLTGLLQKGKEDFAQADAEARAAADHATRLHAEYEQWNAELRAGWDLMVSYRDQIAAIVATTPSDHPDRAAALEALRTAEERVRETGAMLVAKDERERVMHARDVDRAAVRAIIDAAAGKSPLTRVRRLVDARKRTSALQRRWAAEDRRQKHSRDGGRRKLAVRRVQPRARRRGSARRLARAPAAAEDGSGPPRPPEAADRLLITFAPTSDGGASEVGRVPRALRPFVEALASLIVADLAAEGRAL